MLKILARAVLPSLLVVAAVAPATAQVSGPPSGACHVTDGTFTACPGGPAEWSDVTPIPFPGSNSYLYVNQGATHTTLYLMYDLPTLTSQLDPATPVHINFNTVEQIAGVPKLVVYDIDLFANGTMQVLQQGQPTPPGNIVGAVGFGPSPNSATPHVTAELQVPLVAGPPSTYSDDPLFWTTTLPPTFTLPIPPRLPCIKDPGKQFNRCVKQDLQNAIQNASNLAAFFAASAAKCNQAAFCSQSVATLMALSAAWQAIADRFAYILNTDPSGLNFTLPPDPNFTVVDAPSTYTFALPTTGATSAEATALGTFSQLVAQLAGFQQAAMTALARNEGAVAAGDAASATLQSQAAEENAVIAAALILETPIELGSIGSAFQSAGVQFVLIAQDVAGLQTAINPGSPSSTVQQQFAAAQQLVATQLVLSSAEQAILVPALLAVDPQTVVTLGTGVFPNALSDPTIAASFTQLGTDSIQTLLSQFELQPSFQLTLAGDYVTAGAGLNGQTSGSIAVAGIPTGASVARAFLYWGMVDKGEEAALSQLSLNSSAVTGSLIGSGPDCTGTANSFTYRADVTALVTGNGTYALTSVASGGNIAALGASLVVIYQLTGAPFKTVVLNDGNLSIPNGTPTGSAVFAGPTATAPVAAQTTFIVGEGQGGNSASFTGSAGTPLSFTNPFNSGNGNFWDTITDDVSSVTPAGTVVDEATVTASSCVVWSAQAFSVTTAAPTAPFTATSAQVQTTPTGSTLGKPLTVAPGSTGPTLQDQITAVVQSRTTANRGISGTALTTQLVNGLVNDGVVSSTQGATIQANVVQNLVPPPVPAVCDVNGDGQIDKSDIGLIVSGLNQSASSATDPRDANHDGVINVLDARLCVASCTFARCAVN